MINIFPTRGKNKEQQKAICKRRFWKNNCRSEIERLSEMIESQRREEYDDTN